jgi:small multidrug resistance pump
MFMKVSHGFTRIVPTVSMFLLYGLSFVPMVTALKQMEVGAVYAIWSAAGTAIVAIIGIFLFHEPASALKVFSIALIIVGVVCLNLSMRQPAERDAGRSPSSARVASLPQAGQSAAKNTAAPVLASREALSPPYGSSR